MKTSDALALASARTTGATKPALLCGITTVPGPTSADHSSTRRMASTVPVGVGAARAVVPPLVRATASPS